MDILGIGPLELIFVLVIALIIIGPKDMGKTARRIGRFLNRLYRSEGWRAFLEASRNLRSLPSRLAREAELEELRQVKEVVNEASREVAHDLQLVGREIRTETQEVVHDLRAVEAGLGGGRSPDAPPQATEKANQD